MSGMKRLRLQERLIDPRSPDRRPRRAAYALPTLFTAGNVFLGFYAIMEAFRGALLNAQATAQAPRRAAGTFAPRRSPSAWPCFSTAWTAASRA